jgi:uncharacterized protein (DUF302 family)
MPIDTNTEYTMDRTVSGNFAEVVDRTSDALSEEGFGILCDIDVQEKFAEKLDEDFEQYRILGACNPPLAYDALSEEQRLGTLLPCNVIVYERDNDEIGISAVDPLEMLSVTTNPDLDPIATKVRDRLQRVLDDVASS